MNETRNIQIMKQIFFGDQTKAFLDQFVLSVYYIYLYRNLLNYLFILFKNA